MRRLIVSLIGIIMPWLMPAAREISGTVTDSDSVAIEFANVAAFACDSIVGGGMTDAAGIFRIEVSGRCDSVRVSYVGYDDAVISPVPDNGLGRIVLRRSSTTLREVVVKAPLIRREADRIILNIEANPLSANKDAQELLRTAPGVWATDDALSIYGQGGTAVYVDDRKVNMSGRRLMTYLKSLQSSSIATIEVIPKAGAEYSASSSGGVIRINLRRKRVDGVNGSAGLNVNAGEYSSRFNPMADVSMHSGRWTVNLNGNLSVSPSDRYTAHEELTNTAVDRRMTGVARHKNRNLNGSLLAGVFYEPTGHDKIGVQLELNPGNSRQASDSRTETDYEGTTGITSGRYVGRNRSRDFNAALNWSHSLDDKGSVLKLISNYNYQYLSGDEDNEMRWSPGVNDSVYRTDNSNRYHILVSELSLRKVFNKQWKLNVGVKHTFNDVTNKSFHHFLAGSEWRPAEDYDYDMSYDENIAAAYATVNGGAGRWKFKAGLRAEYSATRGSASRNDRLNLFPNINLTYDLTSSGDYTVGAGYYRHIRRPSFWSLNPVERQVSDYCYTVGNPRLVPSFTDALSLDFVLARKFTIAAGYSAVDSPIRQMFVSHPDHPERMYLAWGNEGRDRNTFVHADGFVNITKWWSLYSSVTYMVTSQKLSDAHTDTFGYIQLVASTIFQLPGRYSFTVNCFYNSRMKIGNISVSPLLNLNPTLQKRFGRHWSASIGVEDMLQRTSRIRTSSSGYTRLAYTRSYISAKIGVTYSFTSGKKFRTSKIEKNADTSRLAKD